MDPAEQNVYMAKLAEQAERYDEMVEYMKEVARAQTGSLSIRSCPIVALLGVDDEMWPAGRFLEAWEEVAAAGFRAVPIADVPHHRLMAHARTLDEVFAELAATSAEWAQGPPGPREIE